MAVEIIQATMPNMLFQDFQKSNFRVAVYCRVSTASDEQLNSYHQQMSYYINKIESNSEWEFVDVYADEATTGTKTYLRDEFNRLMKDCHLGKIDLIIVKSISRFARNTLDCLAYIRELRSLNVDVYFEKENIHSINPASEFILTIHAMHAQEQSISISNNLRWSVKKRMKNGVWLPNYVGYGYLVEEDSIVKDDKVAPIIDKIKNWYLDGLSTAKIAKRLENEKIETPKGKKQWSDTMVNHILIDPMYRGELVGQKTYTTDTFPFERKRNHGEKEKYRYLEDHEPYISEKEAMQIDKMMNKRKQLKGISNHTNKYQNRNYLSGKVKCAICNSTMKRTTITSGNERKIGYQCVQHIKDHNKCTNKIVYESTIQNAFVKAVNKLKDNIYILEDYLRDLEVLNKFTKSHSILVEFYLENENIKKQIYETVVGYNRGFYESAFYMHTINDLRSKQLQIREEMEKLKVESGYYREIELTLRFINDLKCYDYVFAFNEELFESYIQYVIAKDQSIITFQFMNGLCVQELMED